MHFKPDYKLAQATKVIENLDDSEDSELIKYYIKSKEDWIEKQNKRLKEYNSFFELLGKFLPKDTRFLNRG